MQWAGEKEKANPVWLDSAVVVLVAALDTMDHEAAQQQPQGMFDRLKFGDEIAKGGVLGWVRAAVRFHRGQR